jgi:hypothetical protein
VDFNPSTQLEGPLDEDESPSQNHEEVEPTKEPTSLNSPLDRESQVDQSFLLIGRSQIHYGPNRANTIARRTTRPERDQFGGHSPEPSRECYGNMSVKTIFFCSNFSKVSHTIIYRF